MFKKIIKWLDEPRQYRRYEDLTIFFLIVGVAYLFQKGL